MHENRMQRLRLGDVSGQAGTEALHLVRPTRNRRAEAFE
jgi:hypothetical protein